METKKPFLYRLIWNTLNIFYPRYEFENEELIPGEACIFVGNHSQAHGPLVSELRMKQEHITWCVGQILNRKEAAEYCYTDFWSGKPAYIRPFFRLLSRIIAGPISFVLSNANTLPVYHDSRVVSTLRTAVNGLSAGKSMVIFPEHYVGYNHFLCDFQRGFVDTARLYYKRTGKCLKFVPMYIAPKLRKVYYGSPVEYNPANSPEQERERICICLMEEISRIALSLPLHTVVPYPNIPRRNYPQNTTGEVLSFEQKDL